MSDRYAVRRLIDLSDTEGGSAFHQFIGIVEEPDEWLGSEVPTGGRNEEAGGVREQRERNADRVRAIIEKAYEESTLDEVKRRDTHKVARIDRECTVDSDVLQAEPTEPSTTETTESVES